MSPRKRNMLEAFRSAADPGAAPKETSRPAPQAALPKASAPRPKAPPARLPRSPVAFPALPRWLPWVALIGIAFVAGITIGLGRRGVRASSPPSEEQVEAATPPVSGGAPSSAPAAPATSAPASRPNPSSGGNEAALYDTRNQYCVVVATYGATAESLAWATYDHLREAGIPVFTPLTVRKQILVLAGVAPSSAELAELEQKIQSLSRDGRPRVYGDAYRSRIDSLGIHRP